MLHVCLRAGVAQLVSGIARDLTVRGSNPAEGRFSEPVQIGPATTQHRFLSRG